MVPFSGCRVTIYVYVSIHPYRELLGRESGVDQGHSFDPIVSRSGLLRRLRTIQPDAALLRWCPKSLAVTSQPAEIQKKPPSIPSIPVSRPRGISDRFRLRIDFPPIFSCSRQSPAWALLTGLKTNVIHRNADCNTTLSY